MHLPSLVSLGLLLVAPTFLATTFLTSCGGPTDGSLDLEAQWVDATSTSLPFAWPPKVGERFPDLELQNDRGENVRLSDLAGKTLLIEPIGMT